MKYCIRLSVHEAQIFNIANSVKDKPNLGKVLIEDNNLYVTDGNFLIAVPCVYEGERVEIEWNRNWKIGKSKKFNMNLTVDTDSKKVMAYSEMYGDVQLESRWGDGTCFPKVSVIYHSLNKQSTNSTRDTIGIDFSLLSKITSVIGDRIVFETRGSDFEPIAIIQNFGCVLKKPFTTPFNNSIHKPCILMPMRTK